MISFKQYLDDIHKNIRTSTQNDSTQEPGVEDRRTDLLAAQPKEQGVVARVTYKPATRQTICRHIVLYLLIDSLSISLHYCL